MKEADDIDDLFRDAFENFSEVPPINLKENIDKKLYFKNVFLKRFFIYLSLIFTLITSIYFFDSENSVNSENKIELTSNSDLNSEISSKTTTKIGAQKSINKSFIQQSKSNEELKSSIKNDSDLIIQKEEGKNKSSLPVKNTVVTKENLKYVIDNKSNSDSKIINKNRKKYQKGSKNKGSNGNNNLEEKSENNNSILVEKDKSITVSKKISNENEGINNNETLKVNSTITTNSSSSSISINEKNDKSESDKLSVVETFKMDSIQKGDSLNLAVENLKNTSNWMFIGRVGNTYAKNRIVGDEKYSLSENVGLCIDLNLRKSKNNFYYGAGVSYSKSSSTIYHRKSYLALLYVDTTSIPQLDSNNNVTGVIHVLNPVYESRDSVNMLSISALNYSLPIQIGYTFSITDLLKLDLGISTILSYQNTKILNDNFLSDNIVRNNFGAKLSFDPQIRYQKNKWGFVFQPSYVFDFKPNFSIVDIDRKRQYFNFSIGFSYTF